MTMVRISTLFALLIPCVVTQESVEQNESIEEKKFFPFKLLPFMEIAHDLHSGPITVLGPRTIFIQNFHYDGKGPHGHFWVGNGSWPYFNGTLVPDEFGSLEPLKAYTGQNVTIQLPINLTVDRIDYLAVWCVEHKHNFGHTYLKKKQPGGLPEVHLEAFGSKEHNLRSGPIVVVDKKSFFVPNLHYDPEGYETFFWVGKGKEPSPNGRRLYDHLGSFRPLSKYNGQSVYLTLNYNITTDDIDYLGIWCVQCQKSFGHTSIPNDVQIPEINGDRIYTVDEKKITRVKKCCPVNQVLERNGCNPSNRRFNLTVNVRERTDTYALKNLAFVPFVEPIFCKHQTYSLDPKDGNFLLLTNGFLAVLDPVQVYSMDEYCFETVNLKEDNKERWVTTAILCADKSKSGPTHTL